eukprot:SAG11_NODE_16251_length_553_cov_0.792952_2_plen_98_part_00
MSTTLRSYRLRCVFELIKRSCACLQSKLQSTETEAREARTARGVSDGRVAELDKMVLGAQTKLVVLERELDSAKANGSYEANEKRRAQVLAPRAPTS